MDRTAALRWWRRWWLLRFTRIWSRLCAASWSFIRFDVESLADFFGCGVVIVRGHHHGGMADRPLHIVGIYATFHEA